VTFGARSVVDVDGSNFIACNLSEFALQRPQSAYCARRTPAMQQ
jgi:hypothetical protein